MKKKFRYGSNNLARGTRKGGGFKGEKKDNKLSDYRNCRNEAPKKG